MTVSQEEFDALDLAPTLRRAGVTLDEVAIDPQHGALVNERGVRKLAARAPDQDEAEQFIDQFEKWLPDFKGRP